MRGLDKLAERYMSDNESISSLIFSDLSPLAQHRTRGSGREWRGDRSRTFHSGPRSRAAARAAAERNLGSTAPGEHPPARPPPSKARSGPIESTSNRMASRRDQPRIRDGEAEGG